MKALSRNSILFIVSTIAASSFFFNYLYTSINQGKYDNILTASVLFFLYMFVSGFVIGYFDPVRKYRGSIGFIYHLLTYIIVNVVGIIFLLSIIGWSSGDVFGAIFQIVIWGAFLYWHYRASRRKIKGMKNDEAFV